MEYSRCWKNLKLGDLIFYKDSPYNPITFINWDKKQSTKDHLFFYFLSSREKNYKLGLIYSNQIQDLVLKIKKNEAKKSLY